MLSHAVGVYWYFFAVMLSYPTPKCIDERLDWYSNSLLYIPVPGMPIDQLPGIPTYQLQYVMMH
jgi:hypothetical protein